MKWPELIDSLNLSDQQIADELTARGHPIGRGAIFKLRNGETSEPKYSIGLALRSMAGQVDQNGQTVFKR